MLAGSGRDSHQSAHSHKAGGPTACSNWSHNGGTVLRILKIEVPWTLAVEGDRTFGPL